MNNITKRRAKAEMKQFLKGRRSDGLGVYESIIFGVDKDQNKIQLKSLKDIENSNFLEFAIEDKNN